MLDEYEQEYQRKAEVVAWVRSLLVTELSIKLVKTDSGNTRIALYLGGAPLGSVPYPKEEQK